ncbi:MAG TPA: cache domain-containing protein [Anaeromyxobacteraceae bacterium]|nr:cache domain-containing protein [Anaeromyxobacteraceae bacterium]
MLAVFRTLRGRLVLLVFFASLPALLLALYVASTERSSVLQRIQKEASLLAQLASREHAHQLDGAKSLLHRLELALGDEPGPPASGRCPEFLPALLAGYPQFTTIGILSADGRLLCSAHPAPPGLSFAGNAAFERALGSREVAVGDYTIGPVVGRPVLHVALAIREPGGPVRMVLFVGLDLQWLDHLFQQADLPPEYGLLIADRNGHVLGRSAGVAWPTRDGGDPALARVVSSPGAAVLEVPGGGRRLLVAAPMGGIPGVSVVASLPYERVHGEASRAFYRTVAGLTLLTLLTIAGALLAAEISVLRILRVLSHTARRFGGGDLAARAEVPSRHGELTELTRTFNAMADALAARQREAIEGQLRLRALSQRLAVARESEAGRIARELHDELGQVLTSVKVDLANLHRAVLPLAGGGPAAEAMRASVSELNQRIDDAVGFVRRVSSDLRPPVLDRLGLAAALEGLAREFEMRTRLAVVLEVNRLQEPLDWLTSITIFRIVQEALTNVVRHADAAEVSIDLRGTDEGLVLVFRDDGKGIAGVEDARSLGILGMKERCLLVGGSFDISGGPGRGTTIVVRIPRGGSSESDGAHPAG